MFILTIISERSMWPLFGWPKQSASHFHKQWLASSIHLETHLFFSNFALSVIVDVHSTGKEWTKFPICRTKTRIFDDQRLSTGSSRIHRVWYVWQPFLLATPLHPKLVYKSSVVCTSFCQSSNTAHLISILPASQSISFPADPGHNRVNISWLSEEPIRWHHCDICPMTCNSWSGADWLPFRTAAKHKPLEIYRGIDLVIVW